MTKAKKSIIVISIIVVIIGIIVGGVFGGQAAKKAKEEKKWQALQGHDTALVWVNINNKLAEPKNIEGDEYNYENYIVEVPNTTQLCVQSYNVGKDATGEFYADADCKNKIADIKNIVCDEYSKTLYIKITARKGEERIVKIDITVDHYLAQGTIRKANPDGHIEIPDETSKIEKDGKVYSVLRQSNVNVFYENWSKNENIIFAENIQIDRNLSLENQILNGNGYELSLNPKGSYKYIAKNENGLYGFAPSQCFEVVFTSAINSTISNLTFNSPDDKVVYTSCDAGNHTLGMQLNRQLMFVEKIKNSALSHCFFINTALVVPQSYDSIFNNIVVLNSYDSNGVVALGRNTNFFNVINYTDNDSKIRQRYFNSDNELNSGGGAYREFPSQERYQVDFYASGGICTSLKNGKIIDCFNFMDTQHGEPSGGISCYAGGDVKINNCTNYGDLTIRMGTNDFNSRRPVDSLDDDEYAKRATGGIVGYHIPTKTLEIEVKDCNNYGNYTVDASKKEYINRAFKIEGFQFINYKDYGKTILIKNM